MDDPYHLQRFLDAQEGDYQQALSEIKAGRKRSHWIWYIFPQIDGLAFSRMSEHYAIKSLAEAEAYLAHPVLGKRLLDCVDAALANQSGDATEIFGQPDDLKVRSCATLFANVSPPASPFHRLIEKFYPGGPDLKTLTLLGINR